MKGAFPMYASAYVWAKILGHLEATLGTVIVSNSFDDAEVVELNEEQLILYSPSEFRVEVIRRRYSKIIEDALKEIFNSNAKVIVFGDKEMKAYKEKAPVMVIGGTAGSFLGEYQAGGVIIVLGLESKDKKIVGFFPCTGMHGGKMFLRSECKDVKFPSQVTARPADKSDMEELKTYVTEYCDLFGYDINEVLTSPFTVVTPDSKNPYKQMYVAN